MLSTESAHPLQTSQGPEHAIRRLENRAPPFYRPELDQLRFIAFSCVFCAHILPAHAETYTSLGISHSLVNYIFVPLVRAGGHGVDLVFVLSAFLITELLLRECDKTGTVKVKLFYIRRILRIWPLYFVFILLTFPLEIFTSEIPILYYGMVASFIGNWYPVFFGRVESVTGHLWTISVEEQFYLIWPVLLIWTRPRVLLATLVGLFIASTLYRTVLIVGNYATDVSVHNNTFTRMDCFALGGILAYCVRRNLFSANAAVRVALLTVCALLYILIGWIYSDVMQVSKAWTYIIGSIASVLCVFAVGISSSSSSTSNILNAWRYLGKISYGLYMWHVPASWIVAASLANWRLDHGGTIVAGFILSAALTYLMAAASYALLEKPFLRMKQRFTLVESRPI